MAIDRDEARNRVYQATVEATKLESALAERVRLEDEMSTMLSRKEDYSLLALCFDRRHLQAWLVQEAQVMIGDAANSFLANISEGMLSLSMDPKGDELDLRITDLSSGHEPMDASSISGSQVFRVAVALALAIGLYSGGGSRDIRAVMIDEGFGGLDDDGRREMIKQLKSLASVLERIILVSHQDEFQTAFPNGYHIEKMEGISRVVARRDDL
jgi:DNA repair exonuclease SbcCD ATPase subunit